MLFYIYFAACPECAVPWCEEYPEIIQQQQSACAYQELQKLLWEAERQIAYLEGELENAKSQIAYLEGELENANARIKAKARKLRELKEALARGERGLSALQKQYSQLAFFYRTNCTDIAYNPYDEEFLLRKSSTEKSLTRDETTIEKVACKVREDEAAEMRRASLEKTIAALKKKLQHQEIEMSELSEKLTRKDDLIEERERKIDALSRKIEELKNAPKEPVEEKLEKQLEQITKSSKKLEEENRLLKSKITGYAHIAQDQDAHAKQLAEATAALDHARNAIRKKEESLAEQEKEARELINRLKAQEASVHKDRKSLAIAAGKKLGIDFPSNKDQIKDISNSYFNKKFGNFDEFGFKNFFKFESNIVEIDGHPLLCKSTNLMLLYHGHYKGKTKDSLPLSVLGSQGWQLEESALIITDPILYYSHHDDTGYLFEGLELNEHPLMGYRILRHMMLILGNDMLMIPKNGARMQQWYCLQDMQKEEKGRYAYFSREEIMEYFATAETLKNQLKEHPNLENARIYTTPYIDLKSPGPNVFLTISKNINSRNIDFILAKKWKVTEGSVDLSNVQFFPVIDIENMHDLMPSVFKFVLDYSESVETLKIKKHLLNTPMWSFLKDMPWEKLKASYVSIAKKVLLEIMTPAPADVSSQAQE